MALTRERLPVPAAKLGRDLADVVTLVAVLGHRRRSAEKLQVAGADGFSQHAHLAPRVVEVILAGCLVTHRLEKPRHAVAQNALPAVPERQRPRGVGADELHHGALPAPLGVRAEAVALGEDPRQPRPAIRGREEHVEEPGSRDLGALDLVHAGEMREDRLRHLAGRAPV